MGARLRRKPSSTSSCPSEKREKPTTTAQSFIRSSFIKMGDMDVVFKDSNDPFGDFGEGDDGGVGGNRGEVHIRVQQRNGRKCLTTVQGLAADLDIKKILKYIKKSFNCNGAVVDDKAGAVIQLQGDQRDNVKKFLTTENICIAEEVKVHGF